MIGTIGRVIGGHTKGLGTAILAHHMPKVLPIQCWDSAQ